MKNEMSSSLGRNGKGVVKNKSAVMLNLIQHLPRLLWLLPLRNGMRGRFRIKYGMTPSFNNGNGGFTLIELLVVVLIIGILAAVALPQYKVAVAKSHLATVRPLLATIKQAEEAYYMANGEYTYDWDMLGVDLSACISPRSGADIRQCGNYFIVDPLKDETPVVYAAYCPSYIQTTAMTSRSATDCRNNGDFTYTVWFTHSDNPDKIECTGSTDLGRKVCGSLNL